MSTPSKKEIYEAAIQKYMESLAKFDVDGLNSIFTEDAQVYSPLLGWLSTKVFFEKMHKIADPEKSSQIPHNTLISSEGKNTIAKHFTYNLVLKDGRKTSFEAVDIFEFNDQNLITKETIIYDTHQLRIDMGGNILDFD